MIILYPPKMLQVTLQRSKTDQIGKHVKVFIGRTDGLLCQVTAILHTWQPEDHTQGHFKIHIGPRSN